MKVLIADDEDLVRGTLKKIVANLGHRVIEASDGSQAWQQTLLERPRLIIADWNMPESSGLDLCAKVRKRKDDDYIYFILVSGSAAGPEDFREAFLVGVDDFLTKPIKPAEITNRLMVGERILSLTKRVHELEAFVHICAYCKRIRSDSGQYESLESYVGKHSEMNFSHGVCPECMASKFPTGEIK